MSSVTKYPGTLSQTSGGKFRTFNNLNNVKNTTSGSYATSNGLIRGKSNSPNRPSSISATNFNINLPLGAEPTKITVDFAHRKSKATGAKNICNIPAPTIALLGVSGYSVKGSAPTTSFNPHVVKSFNVAGKLSRSQVNSSSFGVKIDYPANTNNYEGTLSIGYIRLIVEYKTSKYSLGLKKSSGGSSKEDYVIEASISNTNLTDYNPALTLTAPVGLNFDSVEVVNDGQINVVNARTITWNPGLNRSVGTATALLRFKVNVTFPTGVNTYTGNFVLSESLNGTSKSHTATITKETIVTEETVEDPVQKVEDYDTVASTDYYLYAAVNEEILFNVTLTDSENDLFNQVIENEDELYAAFYLTTQKYVNGSWIYKRHIGATLIEDESIPITEPSQWFLSTPLTFTEVGTYRVALRYESEVNHNLDYDIREFYVHVRPSLSSLVSPSFTILELGEEEIKRLGDGYVYTAQTFMEEITSEEHVRDWYKNFRLAVFNNMIESNVTVSTSIDPITGETIETITDSTDYENLTREQIFNNAEYWSDPLSVVNAFENLECRFAYNNNYPLYILIVGDWGDANSYTDLSVATIKFTEPCIIEDEAYIEREENGIYPISITDILPQIEAEGNAFSSLTIEELHKSTPIILYDFPLEEISSSNEKISVRGISVSGMIEQTDELTLNVKLKSPEGLIGQRSTILHDNETEFTVGGLGDLWGFRSSDLINLEEWEVELTVENNLLESVANINFHDVKITFYLQSVETQEVSCKVEGEDLRFYGAFIEDVAIPEGLETDTSFLAIEGSDTNDANRQNIREKAIVIELSIGECDIGTSTEMLKQITKLLMTDRDKYDRPIPKRIEFDHRPDEYWEYIVTKAFDVQANIGGYDVKCELVIPSGTSYSKKDIVTGEYGIVQGLASVSPIVSVRPTSSIIEIVETISGQHFNIGYSGEWNNKIVEIHCENQTVLLKTSETDINPIDISSYADFNVDWFSLHGEYHFDTTGCVLRTVTFKERW